MTNEGMICKTYDFYVDDEIAAEAITKGLVVNANAGSNQRVTLTDGDATDIFPYGVALEDGTAAGTTISVCWRGIVECLCTPGATIYKNTPLAAGADGTITAAWTTALAEYRMIGHLLDTSITTASAECKIMLAGW